MSPRLAVGVIVVFVMPFLILANAMLANNARREILHQKEQIEELKDLLIKQENRIEDIRRDIDNARWSLHILHGDIARRDEALRDQEERLKEVLGELDLVLPRLGYPLIDE